jgi:uracil-DNA glycosylase
MLTKLHFYFPVKTTDDLKEYIQAVEDFTSTYKLNNSVDLDVIIHHPAPSGQPQIIKKQSTAPEEESFQLLCEDAQISEQSLFEVDFVRYVIKNANVNANANDHANDQTLSVMKYFPNLSMWNMIRYDARLNQLADAIPLDRIESDTVYPPVSDIFNAFSYMRGDPKIVLLGQDPYHRKGQAHGLSFSVQHGVPIPPSLRNIYKALTNDIPGFVAVKHGNLTAWAEQGVLMLNSGLTVEEGTPGSHLELWEPFTNHLISLLSQKYKGLVFMLWGTKAKAKKALISSAGDHLILECQHPSPQIANNTFEKDCNHFSRANDWLKTHGKTEINWTLK